MNLSYYLDLKSLCNANTKQMEVFFQLAFDILAESQNFSDSLFEESFIRDDDDDVLLLNHKSGQSLYEIFFYTFSGEIGNRIIPIVLHGFGSQNSQINDNIPYGEIEGKIHPNAKLVTPQRTKYLWLLSELSHYYEFRKHHTYNKVLSNDCDTFLAVYLPNVSFTKGALRSYKKFSHDDKKNLIDKIKKLDEYISRQWKNNATFPIEDFSKSTGVDASDESEATKADPKLKRQRSFSIPDLGSIYCFHHIKISNTYRLHFYADPKTKRAYIAYVGGHLKTAKSR